MIIIRDHFSRKREIRDKKLKRFDYESKASNTLKKVINDKHVNNEKLLGKSYYLFIISIIKKYV